jgi:hypothetical protein
MAGADLRNPNGCALSDLACDAVGPGGLGGHRIRNGGQPTLDARLTLISASSPSAGLFLSSQAAAPAGRGRQPAA